MTGRPECRWCSGSGWDYARGDDCRCLGWVDVQPEPMRLSEERQARLERELRGHFIEARRIDAQHLGAVLARAAARGSCPTERQVMRMAKVDAQTAARVVASIRTVCPPSRAARGARPSPTPIVPRGSARVTHPYRTAQQGSK